MSGRILVLCLGNPLMGDDGVGTVVAERLSSIKLPEGVKVVEGGTGGLRLIDEMCGFDKVVVVDAVKTGGPPGRIVTLNMKELLSGQPEGLNRYAHGVDLVSAVKLGYELFPDKMPAEIVLVGVEAKRIEPGVGLSKEVEKTLPRIIETLLRIVEED